MNYLRRERVGMDMWRRFCFLIHQIRVTVSEGRGFLEEMFSSFLISFCKGLRGRGL
jgi:hypothetical protein